MIHGEGRGTWLVGTAGCIGCCEKSDIGWGGGRPRPCWRLYGCERGYRTLQVSVSTYCCMLAFLPFRQLPAGREGCSA
jgi:hypothetical protein